MAYHPALQPLPSTPPPPWKLSSSHLLLIPLTSPFFRLNSRFVILHARNVNSDPSKFSDEDDNVVFLRRRIKRRKPQGGNGRRSRQPRWWSDDRQDDEEEEEEGGILQQLVDNLWILQVFKSYGFFLPIILISLLIATGPKAFLMGSGIPFGLSLLAFAFNKLSESLNSTLTFQPRPKYKHRWSRFDGKWDISMEDENTQQQETRQGEKTKRRSYRTSVNTNSFGGWDELVTEDKTERIERPSGTKERFEMMTGKKLGSSEEER